MIYALLIALLGASLYYNWYWRRRWARVAADYHAVLDALSTPLDVAALIEGYGWQVRFEWLDTSKTAPPDKRWKFTVGGESASTFLGALELRLAVQRAHEQPSLVAAGR